MKFQNSLNVALVSVIFVVLSPHVHGQQRCGEVLTRKTYGISYKTFDNITPNERCVWVIGVPEAVTYYINIIYLGFSSQDVAEGLFITGVSAGIGSPRLTTYHPRAKGRIRVENANLILVTFYSVAFGNDANSTGFVLQYTSTNSGSLTATSPNSTHHISTPNTDGFIYPPSGSNYANNELAAFVFPPRNNLHDWWCFNRVELNVREIEGNCFDTIFLYDFHFDSSNPWVLSTSLCANNATSSYTHTYLETALSLFRSDGSTVRSGFGYSVTGC